jgi:molybdopterin synthase sulfur carrier subunit
MIRVVLPQHLRTLAQVNQEIELEVQGDETIRSVLAALTSKYPMLNGTILDQVSGQRRPFIRFFACGQDLSLEPPETQIPEAVVSGKEPFRIVGAIAGG